MSLEDFGKLWIASSDLTANSRPVKKLFSYGADTVILKTAVENPPSGGKNFVIKNGIIIYYDFSERKELASLIARVPGFLEDAIEGGFLEGFRTISEEGSVSSYSHNGDSKLLSLEQSNEIVRKVKKDFPNKHVVQSFGISCQEDLNLIDRLEGDAVELNLRYYHKSQKTPIFLPHNPELTKHLGLEEEVARYNKNQEEIYNMIERYSATRVKTKPILLKMERRADIMDYNKFYELDFDGFTYSDSGKNVITNRDPRVGFRLINKGKTSGKHLLPGTINIIEKLREKDNTKYISASGGIMKPYDAIFALARGADSVQLCSSIYLNGFQVVKQFSQMLGLFEHLAVSVGRPSKFYEPFIHQDNL